MDGYVSRLVGVDIQAVDEEGRVLGAVGIPAVLEHVVGELPHSVQVSVGVGWVRLGGDGNRRGVRAGRPGGDKYDKENGCDHSPSRGATSHVSHSSLRIL